MYQINEKIFLKFRSPPLDGKPAIKQSKDSMDQRDILKKESKDSNQFNSQAQIQQQRPS
jgi:hypothetical protein